MAETGVNVGNPRMISQPKVWQSIEANVMQRCPENAVGWRNFVRVATMDTSKNWQGPTMPSLLPTEQGACFPLHGIPPQDGVYGEEAVLKIPLPARL